ncbi:uncharacterized protein LOC117783428 isoform X2 [Drosophila innubila]|uniref:uncharacterized protein LOC117783428 isoform X2 n=1 Tax=Drosophila innubila TaxID=198719 RepID=UPI00148D7319|nr:uncharacterized protein LOC117783428 isoform X2 [Drosophila innubila]
MFANKVKKSNSLANNTQQKFKADLMANDKSFCNRSFETASGILRKTGNQLKQTKLTLCQKENKLIFSGFVEEPAKTKLKQEFVYMPPKNVLKKSTSMAAPKTEPLPALPASAMSKPGRNLRSLIGRVDFCIKMNKAQPNLNVIWNVYGCYVHVVGRFTGENRLNTFSVTQVSTADWQQNFTRVENLTTYILMQNN